MLLEERFHEAAGVSYSDAQADGFEVVYDDAVLRNFLTSTEEGGVTLTTGFEPRLFHVSSQSAVADNGIKFLSRISQS